MLAGRDGLPRRLAPCGGRGHAADMTVARPSDPYRDADAATLAQVRDLLEQARHATLGTLDPDSGAPLLTRISMQADADGVPVALLSDLAQHSAALRRDARCGLMVAPQTSAKGSVMAQPRLSLLCHAQLLTESASTDARRRAAWRDRDGRAAVYLGLGDFRFWRLTPVSLLFNAGFGRAFRIDGAALRRPHQSGGDD